MKNVLNDTRRLSRLIIPRQCGIISQLCISNTHGLLEHKWTTHANTVNGNDIRARHPEITLKGIT